MSLLSDRVRAQYPQHAGTLDALRACQMEGLRAGAVGLAAGGAAGYAGATLAAKYIHPIAYVHRLSAAAGVRIAGTDGVAGGTAIGGRLFFFGSSPPTLTITQLIVLTRVIPLSIFTAVGGAACVAMAMTTTTRAMNRLRAQYAEERAAAAAKAAETDAER